MEQFCILLRSTLTSVEVLRGVNEDGRGDQIIFTDSYGWRYVMEHAQDCCEIVYIDDICGDVNDLIGSPLLLVEESTNTNDPARSDSDSSHTWTFYRMTTIKGSVTIRWFGSSNGYYSERVSFTRLAREQK